MISRWSCYVEVFITTITTRIFKITHKTIDPHIGTWIKITAEIFHDTYNTTIPEFFISSIIAITV
jgi:hypothetical protein